MKKIIALSALVLAAVVVAHPACAASNKKSAATTAAAPAGPQWAQMPAGKPHKLRKTYPIRSQDRGDWPTKKAVTLKGGSSDPNCKWDRPVPALDGAKLIVSDGAAGLAAQIILKNGVIVQRNLTEGSAGGDLTWLSSTPGDDWNYFILFKDTKPGAAQKTMIDKWYEVEIFPPKGISAICDPERPESAVTIASVDDAKAARPCEAGTGSGGEPH